MSTNNIRFKIGDRVQWESQAQGYNATKVGIISEIVQPLSAPKTHKSKSLRDHISYVVAAHQVDPQTGKPYHPKTKPMLYWPKVVLLRRAK